MLPLLLVLRRDLPLFYLLNFADNALLLLSWFCISLVARPATILLILRKSLNPLFPKIILKTYGARDSSKPLRKDIARIYSGISVPILVRIICCFLNAEAYS